MYISRVRLFFLIAALLSSAAPAHAQIAYIQDTGTLGDNYAYAFGLSADGTAIAGYSGTGLITEGFIWTLDGGIVGLGTLGGNFSYARAISSDGSTAVGESSNGVFTEAFRWTEAGGIEGLGNLGGNYSEASAVSADGSVVVGISSNGVNNEAFRWTDGGGMVGLGVLPGGLNAGATLVSADGSVVAGYSLGAGFQEAFRWTQGGGMVGLGIGAYTSSNVRTMTPDGSVLAGVVSGGGLSEPFRWTQADGMVSLGSLGGTTGRALAISTDGSVIVGESDTGLRGEAFRWTAAGGMVSLGTLVDAPNADSYATDVSADGSVVVGSSSVGFAIQDIFRWTEQTGMQSLTQLLIDAGVDMSAWALSDINGIFVSDDGQVIGGTGLLNGDDQAFIAVAGGIITPEELARSTSALSRPAVQAQGALSQGMNHSLMVARNALSVYFPPPDMIAAEESAGNFENLMSSFDPHALQDIATAAGGDDRVYAAKRKSFFITGSIGAGQGGDFSNTAANGATGALVQVSSDTVAGAGIVVGGSREETYLDGENRTSAAGVVVMAAYEPASGWRVYGAASGSVLDISTDRHYLNGAGVDGSSGDTSGTGFGLAVRGGYEFSLYDGARVMPYVDMDVSHVSIDAYTETGGGFPAVVDSQNETYVASRLGVEVSHDVTPDLVMRGRVAWGHRYSDSAITVATVAGAAQSIPSDTGARDWAEGSLGVNYKISRKTTLTADFSGRTGETSDPAINAIAGLVWVWD